jgi:hypothetical protein
MMFVDSESKAGTVIMIIMMVQDPWLRMVEFNLKSESIRVVPPPPKPTSHPRRPPSHAVCSELRRGGRVGNIRRRKFIMMLLKFFHSLNGLGCFTSIGLS